MATRTMSDENLREHEGKDGRVQHEMRQMQHESDLDEIDDDVEEAATIYEWEALEHRDHPANMKWFPAIASAITVAVVVFLLFFNIIGAILTIIVGVMFYKNLQKHPKTARYRIMVDGVAINNMLHHYRDLEAFNVVYEPNSTQMVLLTSKRNFSPLITMEIGESDPVDIRDTLLEFLPEDQELDEPIVDSLARRIGF